ncbi:MAG TPA: IS3 family transposase [Cyclobacteriaceae bacterium]|nr:IS3 family transposase [Cyclobacteriaceae bacterium]
MKQRKESKSRRESDLELLRQIEPIKLDHPAWGYRRVWAYLRYRQDVIVGKNRVYRILKEHHLLALDHRKLRAKRTPGRPKPTSTEPNKLWGIDMTKIKVESWGWLYLVAVKDWASKKIVGWSLSTTSKTGDWLDALQMAVNKQFPEGIRESAPVRLVSDNGCQPTSANFMAACKVLGIKQIFTSFNNPKGNADTERLFRTMKEDLIWLQEWFSYQQLHTALTAWIDRYNNDYPHSTINYLTPQQYEEQNTSHIALKYSLNLA